MIFTSSGPYCTEALTGFVSSRVEVSTLKYEMKIIQDLLIAGQKITDISPGLVLRTRRRKKDRLCGWKGKNSRHLDKPLLLPINVSRDQRFDLNHQPLEVQFSHWLRQVVNYDIGYIEVTIHLIKAL